MQTDHCFPILNPEALAFAFQYELSMLAQRPEIALDLFVPAKNRMHRCTSNVAIANYWTALQFEIIIEIQTNRLTFKVTQRFKLTQDVH